MTAFPSLVTSVPAIMFFLAAVGVMERSASVEGIQLHKQWTAEDAELGPPLIQEITHSSVTHVACAATCLRLKTPNCTAVSFKQNGGVGTCKLGTNRTNIRAPVPGSTVYSIFESEKPPAGVGLSAASATTPMTTTQSVPAVSLNYTRVKPNRVIQSIGEVRVYCLQKNLGYIATVYPDDAVFNAILNAMLVGDAAFLDIVMDGNYSQKTFVTGLGVRFNASALDPHQHWASGQPNVSTDEVATVVVMRKPADPTMVGWDDSFIDKQAGVNVVFCADDGNPYRLIPSTGKYYRLYTGPKTQSDARAACVADGGNLANGLRVIGSNRWDVLDLYYDIYNQIWLDGVLQPDKTTYAFADGSRVDHTSDRMMWENLGGFNALTGNCVALELGSTAIATFTNANCQDTLPFLCERGFR